MKTPDANRMLEAVMGRVYPDLDPDPVVRAVRDLSVNFVMLMTTQAIGRGLGVEEARDWLLARMRTSQQHGDAEPESSEIEVAMEVNARLVDACLDVLGSLAQ
jgi:hypothetical protein